MPYALGEALFAAAGEPKRFLHLPGAHHNDVFEQTALLDAIADFARAAAAAHDGRHTSEFSAAIVADVTMTTSRTSSPAPRC